MNPDHLEAVTNGENVLRGIGLSAQAARKTACAAGHPLSGANLIWRIDKRGRRFRACRICKLVNVRAYKRRRRTRAVGVQ